MSGIWDASTANWTDGVSASVFVSGADVRFDDTAATRSVTLSGSRHAGQVLFENALDYTLSGSVLAGASFFVKRGAGELKIAGTGHTFEGDMLIEKGTLTVTADNDTKDVTSGPLGNPRVPRTITVTTNGTLNLIGKNPFGAGTSTTPIQADLRIVGGTLNLTTNFCPSFNSVLFDNAAVNYYGGLYASRFWGTANFGSNITFKGKTPYVFDVRGSNCGFIMGKFVQTELCVEDITGDGEPDVTFFLPLRNTAHSDPLTNRDGVDTRFRKTGPGTLALLSPNSDFTGDVSVVEGTLTVATNKTAVNPTSSLLGNTQVSHPVFVGTDATLCLAFKDAMGHCYSSPKIEIVVSGGTLSQADNMANVLGPLTLENANLVYSGRYGDWGTFIFDGDVTFRGTNAYNLAEVNGSRIRCGYNRLTVFDVEDIPGTNIDVTIGMQINDCQAWTGGLPARPSRFGKRGAGTLRLANHGSTFTGDVDVAEGVLQVPYGAAVENKVYSCLGNPQVATRTLVVHSGAELYFMVSDVFGQLASSVKMATVISNATFRQANSGCTGFGPITLHNAKVIYNGGPRSDYGGSIGSRVWGVMGLGGRTVFSGTNAYTFAVVGNNCRFNLGYSLDFSEEDLPGVTNYNGKSEFVVRDISEDSGADVTFEAPLQDIPTWPNAPLFKSVTFKCGLLKSGEGTLRLTSTDNTYTGPTVVTQGVLRVDGALTSSEVTVKTGACIGGTGTVSNVTLEEGAVFDVFADQTKPLKVSALTVTGGGTIVVHNPDGFACDALNTPFLQVTGTVNGAMDASAWSVLMDGVDPTPDLKIKIGSDGIVYARWAPQGTLIRLL